MLGWEGGKNSFLRPVRIPRLAGAQGVFYCRACADAGVC